MTIVTVRTKSNTALHKWGLIKGGFQNEYEDIENWLNENNCYFKLKIFGLGSTISQRLDFIEFFEQEELNLFRLMFGHKYRIQEVK